MRHLNSLVLLASLQLCRARFSIYDDVLVHPQFEILLADDVVSEHDALALLHTDIPVTPPAASAVPPKQQQTSRYVTATHSLSTKVPSRQVSPRLTAPIAPAHPQPPTPTPTTMKPTTANPRRAGSPPPPSR